MSKTSVCPKCDIVEAVTNRTEMTRIKNIRSFFKGAVIPQPTPGAKANIVTMIRHVACLTVLLQFAEITVVQAAQQQLKLSDSYLPVAMQVIAHLTDQMAFEVKDEPQSTKRPATTTKRPVYVYSRSFIPYSNGWAMRYGLSVQTTPYHAPGLFAPHLPPKPSDRLSPKSQHRFVLLPLENNSQYTVIGPLEKRTEEPLLSIDHEEVRPLMEPVKGEAPLLPPHFSSDKLSRSDEDRSDEENLQYLSDSVREMIKMANDPDPEQGLTDVWLDGRAGPNQQVNKAAMSSSNLRLLLLYDLLSREAKRQKLSDYSGFSPAVMKVLVGSSNGGARAQLSLALSKMLERNDCEHQYANNRAREMVTELGQDSSKLSSEIRYLQPLVYTY